MRSGADVVHQLANILLSEDLTPKLTDFGLAKLIETSVHTVAGATMGSPPYMSPEQAGGKATDMCSLGITLYELLSTRTPFEGDMSQVMAQHITQLPEPLIDLCPKLAPEISELRLFGSGLRKSAIDTTIRGDAIFKSM